VTRLRPQAWIEAEARRAAARAALTEADWARLDRLLAEARWRTAVTYAHTNPHCYTLRKTWNDADFCWVVTLIRTIGERERFPDVKGGRYYDVLNRHGKKYWPMGWPLNWPNGQWATTLLNRKPPVGPGDRTL
jgi:hypothetical protein